MGRASKRKRQSCLALPAAVGHQFFCDYFFDTYTSHRSPFVRWALLAICLILAGMCQSASAQDVSPPGGTPIRDLYGEELLQARDARDHADRLRASFEDRYRWSARRGGATSASSPTSEAAQRDYRRVVEAYRLVSERHPNTEIAAYSQLRLSGFHQYRREHDLALLTAQEVAETYPGSHYENRAYFIAGMVELQGRHEPQAAMEWLKKVRRPIVEHGGGDEQPAWAVSREEQLYIAAQQQIVRAENMIGESALAQARAERIGERYPAYADHAKQRLAADQDAFIKGEFQIDLDKMLDERINDDLVAMTVDLRQASSEGASSFASVTTNDNEPTTDSPTIAKAAMPEDESTPATVGEFSLGFWLGLAISTMGVGLLGTGTYLYFTQRKETRHAK